MVVSKSPSFASNKSIRAFPEKESLLRNAEPVFPIVVSSGSLAEFMETDSSEHPVSPADNSMSMMYIMEFFFIVLCF